MVDLKNNAFYAPRRQFICLQSIFSLCIMLYILVFSIDAFAGQNPSGGGTAPSSPNNGLPSGLPPDIGVPGLGATKPPLMPDPEIPNKGPNTGIVIAGGPAPFGIPAKFAVAPNNGEVVYTVPIDIPPGVAKLEPHVSLQYSSGSGDGQVGMGWSISGLSEIVRCPQTIAINNVAGGVNDDGNDRFCMDGQQLIAVPAGGYGTGSAGAYGAAGTHYAKEIDDFSQIISYGGTAVSPGYFEVKTKSGLILEYGSTPNQTLSSSAATGNVTEVWGLAKVTDQQSNYMSIYYSTTPISGDNSLGFLYPTQISYTGNTSAGTSAINSIKFSWQTRTDAPTTYAAGSPHEVQDRLTAIKTYVSSNLISNYELAYQYGASTQRSELTSITKLDDASPQNALPALTFGWSAAKVDVQPDLITSIANGFGASTNITYMPTTAVAVIGGNSWFPLNVSYPQATGSPSAPVVTNVQHNVPTTSFVSAGTLGNNTTTYSYNFGYVNPVVDLSGRGNLGFSFENTQDLQTGLQIVNVMAQIFPWIGDPTAIIMEISATGSAVDAYSNSYGFAGSAQGTVLPYMSGFVEVRNDIQAGASFNNPTLGPALPTTREAYTYDSTGPGGSSWDNLIKKVTTTSDGYKTTINDTYAPANTINWLINLVSQETLATQGIGQSNSQTRTTSYNYDTNVPNEISSIVIEPTGATNIQSTTSYSYDGFGNIISQTISGGDVSNVTTSATYDSRGQFPTSVTSALNQIESVNYNTSFGELASDTDINGQKTTYSYDTFGRLTKAVKPGINTETFGYPLCLTSSCVATDDVGDYLVGADGSTVLRPPHWISYDAIGRKILDDHIAFDNTTTQVAYIYDANGNLVQQTNPYSSYNGVANNGNPPFTKNSFDELGRVLSTTYADGSLDTTRYNGQTINTTDGLQQTASIFRDGHGNISWSKDSLGNSIAFAYDGFDQQTQVTDTAGNVTNYKYDIRGRAISGIDPDKGAWTATYNSLGQLVTSVSANELAHGQSTTMSYDALGRMVQRVEPDMTGNWTYDGTNGIGEIASETSSGIASPSAQVGVTGFSKTYSYDGYGRLTQTSTTDIIPWNTANSGTYTENYAYDSIGRPARIYNSRDGVDFAYNNPSGYPTGETQDTLQSPTGTALWTNKNEDAAGSVTSATYGTAVAQNFAYDPNTERMTRVNATVSGDAAPLESINYNYDVLGNVTNRTINPSMQVINGGSPTVGAALTEYYTYDGLNRLCTVNTLGTAAAASPNQSCVSQPGSFYPGLSLSYTTIGGISIKTDVGLYNYPTAGHPLPHAVQSITAGAVTMPFTYDGNGNMTAGDGRTNSFTSFDRLQSATLNGDTLTYYYDPDHQRATRANSQLGQLDEIYLDHFDLAAAASNSGNNNVKESHFYFDDAGGNRVGEIDRPGITNSANGTPAVKFYLNDWQNSVSVIADANGNILEDDSYDAWGKRRNLNGAPDPNNTLTSQAIHGYTNQEQSPAIQLVNLNARMYDPYIATMLSVDPLVAKPLDQQTWNAYTYARNNPMAYTDPTGMLTMTVCLEGDCAGASGATPTTSSSVGGGLGDGSSLGISHLEANLTDTQASIVANGGSVNVGGGFTYSDGDGTMNLTSGGTVVAQLDDPDMTEPLSVFPINQAAVKQLENMGESQQGAEHSPLAQELPAVGIPAAEGTKAGVVNEATNIVTSPEMAHLAQSYAAGEAMTVNIDGRIIQYEPGLPASGMTMFGENGFVMGPDAFQSNLEQNSTVLQELYRLTFTQSAGGLSGELATYETQAAFDFAQSHAGSLP